MYRVDYKLNIVTFFLLQHLFLCCKFLSHNKLVTVRYYYFYSRAGCNRLSYTENSKMIFCLFIKPRLNLKLSTLGQLGLEFFHLNKSSNVVCFVEICLKGLSICLMTVCYCLMRVDLWSMSGIPASPPASPHSPVSRLLPLYFPTQNPSRKVQTHFIQRPSPSNTYSTLTMFYRQNLSISHLNPVVVVVVVVGGGWCSWKLNVPKLRFSRLYFLIAIAILLS